MQILFTGRPAIMAKHNKKREENTGIPFFFLTEK